MAWAFANSPSKTFAAAAASFCFGILVGPLFLWAPYTILLSMVVSGCSFFLIFQKMLALRPASAALRTGRQAQEIIFFVIIVTAFTFGVFRYGQTLPPPEAATVADTLDRAVRVSGRVDGEVEVRSGTQRVVLNDVSVTDKPVFGRLQASLPKYPSVFYGDTLTFTCTLEQPQPIETFRYDRYLASRNILALCNRPDFVDRSPADGWSVVGTLLAIKTRVTNRLSLLIPEPHASFLSGLLFGGSSSLSGDLRDDFSRTGTSHILAASGFNVSLFTMVFLGWVIETPLGRRRGILATTLLLVVYVIMAGATPAVLRAAFMASLLLIAAWVERKPWMTNVILLTLSLMLLINPRLLLDDVGFQLSFVATLALLIVAKRWETSFMWMPERFRIRESFVCSLAATVCTLPIVLWHFGSVSLVSPIVNLIVLPFVPFLMYATMIALAVGAIDVSLGSVVMLPAWAVSTVVLHIVVWFSALPFANASL